jgi:hypothetical protein
MGESSRLDRGNENPLIITFAEAAAEAYRDTD